MKINYALREAEYKQFVSDVSVNYFKTHKKWFIGIAALFFLVHCLYAQTWTDALATFVPFIVLVSIWILILRLGTVASRALKNGRHRQLILGNQSVELLDDKIIFTTESSISQFDWKSLADVKESDMCIYLSINQASYIIVPKRAFENEMELNNFKQIIERNKSK